MHNDELRRIWNERAEYHAARKLTESDDAMSRFYHTSWWRHIEPLLSNFPSGTILEAGCGTGRWAEHLVPLGYSVTLTDISPVMLKKAREHAERKGFVNGVILKEFDVCDLHPFADNSFDMVISTGEPISLCADPEKAFSEYCRVVRPGGYVLCDAGNKYRRALEVFTKDPSAAFLTILETGEHTAHGNMDLHLFGPSELKKNFETLGMTVHTLAGLTPMLTFPPSTTAQTAMQDQTTLQALEELERKYTQTPEIIALSSRLIIVAQKPH
ncbi:methyltransferase domain-containing protein [Pseudodesulfovibrio sp. JC047]|uniref:class I SAM-dependent methyltransferase n=1 Tax=Pseudodesulfovibrio sp. JC047 TaxID=2683199 RepID=UPI0013D0A401|nr:class I SAM-dependent methyltransferase [Pseudodesulfovibrio sp. JC047]NDV19718.1 methyltransferase domain-containing protein [Pseudodesulfovibrio sp. JC047]